MGSAAIGTNHTLYRETTFACFSLQMLTVSEERLGATRIYKRGIGDDSCLEVYRGFQTKVDSSYNLVRSFLFRTGKNSLEVKIL